MADKGVVHVVLRVHVGPESNAGDDVHGEAAEAPAGNTQSSHADATPACVPAEVEQLLVDVKGFSRLGVNAEVCHQDVARRVDERDHLGRSGGDTSKAVRKQYSENVWQWRHP